MSDRDPMVHIRMPATLRDALQARAKAEARSMNAEIVQRLEESLAGRAILDSLVDDVPCDTVPRGADERAMLRIFRGLSLREKAALKGLLNGIMDGREIE